MTTDPKCSGPESRGRLMDADTQDAERYRFLRDKFAEQSPNDEEDFAQLAHHTGEDFDRIIDLAMQGGAA